MRMSLRAKLILIIVGVSFTPLLAHYVVVTFAYKRIARQNTANQMGLIARMGAEYSVSNLASGNKAAAERSLGTLFLMPEVAEAQIYDDQGRVFAAYWSEGKSLGLYAKGGTALPLYPDRIDPLQAASVTLLQDRLEILQPIASKDRSYGTLRLVASAAVPEAVLSARLRVLTVVSLGLLLLTILLAWVIQGHISRPILWLAGLTQEVSRTHDYSTRAALKRADEIGTLAKGLNDMLASLQAQSLLRDQAEERLRFALETIHTGAWDLNLVDHTAFRSMEHDRIFGYAKLLPQWTYEMFLEHVVSEDRAAVDEKFRHAMAERGDWNFECRIRRVDGEIRWIRAAGRHHAEAASGMIRMAGIVQDITEHKRSDMELQALNQKLAASNKELESFSYSVAHDLRSPLRAIDGFSQALLEDYSASLDAQGREYLARAREGVQRMAQMIDDLLKLARLGYAPMVPQAVDLSALAGEAAAELRKSQPGREAEFVLAPGLVAAGDPVLLRSVMRNLLENAWKFTAKKPWARIEFGAVVADGVRAYFVRDDGAGFDMAYADKLFGIFQRLHTVTEFPGTGIGLAMVQRIIQRHGGRVWAEGAVNRGATFYFTLPEGKV